MLINWHQLRKNIQLNGQHFINGKSCDSHDGSTISKKSPIDGSWLLDFARGKKSDIDSAVDAADNAFQIWSNLQPSKRKELLLNFANIIEQNKEELALLETIDMGKPVQESLSVDLNATINCFRYYAEAIDKIYGEVAPTANNSFAYIVREPVGVVGVIVPWNYPLIMTAWKLAPALAVGNTVVVKPSERSPLTAIKLAKLASEAGIPDGVINVVCGYGHEAGEALALHDRVRVLGFTGSVAVGKKILAYSSQSNLKHVYNELGGKSAVLVFNDYHDLDNIARGICGSMFYNQGQSCNAPSRVLVSEDIADELIQLLVQKTKQFKVGDPFSADKVLGAVVDEKHMNHILSYIESGYKDGAKCLIGGKQINQESGGYYLEPAIFDHVTMDMKIAQEEIFGPVLSVIRFKTEEEAIKLANSTEFGLQAGIWSNDINRVHRVARKLQAGTVHVNQYDGDNITVPFGGVKQSGNGRDKSLHALDKYSELKTIWIQID